MLTSAAVNELVRVHVPLVSYHVRQMLRRLPANVDRDDLMSAGLAALVIAVQRYDSDVGIPFTSFLSARIRWALVDELRMLDPASRSTRRRARQVDAVGQQLAAALARTPTSTELAEALDMPITAVQAIARDVYQATVLSLQGLAAETIGMLMSDGRPSPEDVVLSRERIGYLHDAITLLPERLRTVIVLYFLEERPVAVIATALGVTASRVSQLRTDALTMLRDGINAQLDPDLVRPRRPKSRVVTDRRAAYHARIATSGDLHSRLAATDVEGLPTPRLEHHPAGRKPCPTS